MVSYQDAQQCCYLKNSDGKEASMVSNITILGKAGDVVEGHEEYRYIIVDSYEPFDEKSFESKIPVKYWNRGISRVLRNIPNGHYVCIFGRLESDPNIGLYILVEQIRHFSAN